MIPVFISRTELLDRLDIDTVLITGNQRLAASIRDDWDQRAVSRGEVVWESPEIIPWQAWLQHMFKLAVYADSTDSAPVLLNSLQEKLLWEQVITHSGIDTSLLQLSSTANKARDAWNLIYEWALESEQRSHWSNEDSRQFAKWMEEFRQHCQSKGWITTAEIAHIVSSRLDTIREDIPGHLVLTGFDELTPQQKLLLNAFEVAGCNVEWFEKNSETSQVSVVSAVDTHAEIRLAARWSRAILEENADARIGIIIPELTALRKSVQIIFDRIMSPGMTRADNSCERLYNLSLGKSLAEYPYVQTALNLLQLYQHKIPLQDAGFIITSPYVSGWESERMARYQLDRQLRDDGLFEVSKSRLKFRMNMAEQAWNCPILLDRLEAFDTRFSKIPAEQLPGQWAIDFSKLLTTIGLSQGEGLSSEEFQAAKLWNELIAEMIYMDELYGKINYVTALRILQQSVRDRVFQPQTAKMPVQIMGVMEATGLSFDFVWILGLHDAIWPASSQSNPFIPIRLQRERGLPHSGPQRELQITRHLTQRLTGMARQTIISYPCLNKTESLRKSNLLENFPEIDISQLILSSYPDWISLIHQSAEIDTYPSGNAPALTERKVRGGSQVVKLQAVCPFRAFAELRLNARPMGEPVLGMDAAERGSLVHTMFEYFWLQVKDQDVLLAMSGEELQKLIRQCIEKAIRNRETLRESKFDNRYRGIEQSRLLQMMNEWLPNEFTRQHFRVHSLEQKQEVELGEIVVDLKIDRVDQLDDGSFVVVDYKTGKVSPGQWFGERPEDPQLPLYSMAIEGDLSGVSFALLRVGEYGFKGVTSADGILPGVKSHSQLSQCKHHDDWQSLLNEWKTTIELLTHDFAKGHAEVDPLKYPASCTYCTLTAVCRVNEREKMQMPEMTSESDDDR